jgi:hypothetical protein
MKAVSPRKLIPRIRFTLEMESSTSNANNDNVPVAEEWPLPSQWHAQLEEEEGLIATNELPGDGVVRPAKLAGHKS